MGKWENRKIRKYENTKMGQWDNGTMKKYFDDKE